MNANAELERFVCWDNQQAGLGAFSDIVDDWLQRSRDFASEILSAENKARAAGLYTAYAGNFAEARAALNSMTSILTVWYDESVRVGQPYTFCLVRRGLNYQVGPKTSGGCLDSYMYEGFVIEQARRIRAALGTLPTSTQAAAPTSIFTSLLTMFDTKTSSGDDDAPPITVKPTVTPSLLDQRLMSLLTKGVTAVSDPCTQPQYAVSAGAVDYNRAMTDPIYYRCADAYLGGTLLAEEIARLRLSAIAKSNPSSLSTPQPGTVPFRVDAASIKGLFDALGAGWSEIEKARLQAQLLKSAREKTPTYISAALKRMLAQQQQQQQAPWGWIVGGIGLLAVGGLVLYAMSGKRKGGVAASAPALPASVVPASIVPAKA